MSTAFGPQGLNYTVIAPSQSELAQNRSGSLATWAQDCTSKNAEDGTVLDANYHNMIMGNLRHLVEASGVALSDGDLTLVHQAVNAVVATATGSLLSQLNTMQSQLTGAINSITTMSAQITALNGQVSALQAGQTADEIATIMAGSSTAMGTLASSIVSPDSRNSIFITTADGLIAENDSATF